MGSIPMGRTYLFDISMNDINNLFFELIQVALGVRVCLSHSPTAEEWKMLYDMAKKQSLVGVCFAGVQKLQTQRQEPTEMLYLTWMGMAAKIQQRNETVNKQCVELQERLTKEGFRSCILKGQGNSDNYGQLALLRQSGDIDIWVEGGFYKVYNWAKNIAPSDEINQHHIHFDYFSDTEVELHYTPFVLNNPIRNNVLRKYFAENEDLQFSNQINLPDGSMIFAADNSFNIVFQLVHVFHHLFTEGIGLRQLMDYYFVLRNIEETTRLKHSKACVQSLGICRFASALMWVMGKVFGLEEKYMLWTPCEKDGLFLLNEIMQAGNFGHQDARVPKNMSHWKSFWYLNFYNLRLTKFDYWNWFWGPIIRTYGFTWRKIHGFR